MARGPADIGSPDVIRRFRGRLVKFDEDCRRGLDGARADVNRVLEWLRREQPAYWTQQLNRRERLVEEARSRYLLARYGSDAMRKPSIVDEKKALDKALALRAEAEEKLRAVKKWAATLENRSTKILGPATALGSLLASLTPRALGRLDQMLDGLDEYLRPPVAEPTE